MIVLGFAPVVYLGLRDVGGWDGLNRSLQTVATDAGFESKAWSSAWQPLLDGPAQNPMGVDWFAMVFGLGFVLSFGYWCTNFLVVQRAMAAKNMTAARNTPIVAAIPKMVFPFLVIVPGMIAVALSSMPGKDYRIPPPPVAQERYAQAVSAVQAADPSNPESGAKAVEAAIGKPLDLKAVASLIVDARAKSLSAGEIQQAISHSILSRDYDGVILSLVKKYCPPGLLGVALTALLASFMSGMAGNVTAFNTVWTYDLYQAYLVRNKSDRHYFWAGKITTIVGILLSILAAYFASMYNNAMDIIQLVFGFVNAPLFATFLLGMFWRRTTATGAFLGLFGGIGASALFHSLTLAQGNPPGVKGGYLHSLHTFPSEMAQNFWLATIAFLACFVMTTAISLATSRTKCDEELKGLVYSLTPKITDGDAPWFLRPAVTGVILLALCLLLNWYFW
jgi:SSS family solute:Na+ symporter